MVVRAGQRRGPDPASARPKQNTYRHSRPRSRSQKEQSAAPPAIVPSRYGLISITFFTSWEAVTGAACVPASAEGAQGDAEGAQGDAGGAQGEAGGKDGVTDVGATGGARVDGDDDTVRKLERERGGAVLHVDAHVALLAGVHVRCQELGGLQAQTRKR